MKMGRQRMDGDNGGDAETGKLCPWGEKTNSIIRLGQGQWVYKRISWSKPLDHLYFRFQVNQDKILPTYNQYQPSLTAKIGNRATSKCISTNHNITWVIIPTLDLKSSLKIPRTIVVATHRYYINLCSGSWEWLTQSSNLRSWGSVMA